MSANGNQPRRLKPTIILRTEDKDPNHPPRPFYCCWYRIVFDAPGRPCTVPVQTSTEPNDTRH